MLEYQSSLKDPAIERALISTILKYGKDIFIEIDSVLCSNDFGIPINKGLYTCCSELAQDPKLETFDLESIKMKAKTLGAIDFLNKKNLEYLESLSSFSTVKDNVLMFAIQLKKYAVARDLRDRYLNGIKRLESFDGNDAISELIAKAEGDVLDFISGKEDGSNLELISEGIEENLSRLIEADIIDQVGIPSGFPIWDSVIGGLRGGTVMMISARSKSGKSFLALNQAVNIALKGVPVLYLDSEMNKNEQQNRLICIHSKCPMHLYETGKFKHSKDLTAALVNSSQVLKIIPFHYQSVVGKTSEEAIATARRWLIKNVKLNKNGHANPCVIVYDYIKLTDEKVLKSFNPEYVALGFLMIQLHSFAQKYNVPILGFAQSNRDGINNEDSGVVAGSDRILWNASSLSLLKNKGDEDIGMGCGLEFGNKKLVVLEGGRFGAGLDNNDYINLFASLKPNVGINDACGFIREGYTFSKINIGRQIQRPLQTKPKENE